MATRKPTKGKGGGKDAGDMKLPLQEASYVLKTYSQGATRIPVEKMCCWAGNRNKMGVSGRRAHDLFKTISKDSLALWRYQRGFALAPNPERPFENAEFTNSYVSKQRDMLSPVCHAHLPGSFSKTHLWHCIFTAKQGQFCYYDDKSPMVVNPDDTELMITIQQGMYFEILDYKAFLNHPEAINFLMKGENADASQALKNTEMALVSEYFTESRRAILLPGQDLWDAMKDKVRGESFTTETRKAACALATKLSEKQLQMIVDIFQYYVNPNQREWGSAQLSAASLMPASYPWCKTAPLIANLVCPSVMKDKNGASSMEVGCAVLLKDMKSLHKIKMLSDPVWKWMEDTIQKAVETAYSDANLPKCDSHTRLHLDPIMFSFFFARNVTQLLSLSIKTLPIYASSIYSLTTLTKSQVQESYVLIFGPMWHCTWQSSQLCEKR